MADTSGRDITGSHTPPVARASASAPAPLAFGLSSADAAARLAAFGPNRITTSKSRHILVQLLLRFRNPLVLLLLGASVLSAITGDVQGAAIISCIVLLSVSLDFIQEHRADDAAKKLQKAASVKANVLRDGRAREVPAEEVVPGDVVLLVAGDLVPADGRVLEARDLFVNQAVLTGEPYPVEKHAGQSADLSAPASASGALFMGTSVLSGSGRMQIDLTGSHTALGQIGLSLSRRAPLGPFELSTQRFGAMILRLALLMVLFVILVDLARGVSWLQSFLFAIALAVGLTPELLPMVVSVTLARGALRMSRRKVLVKRLSAIHDLGSMDVLCTDKTGTLTEARIRLEQHLDPAGRDSQRTLELLYVNSQFESGLRSPLDEAVLRHEELDSSAWQKLDEVPFDFERRRVSVLVKRGGERLLIVKGAFEDMLRISSTVEVDGAEPQPIDAVKRSELVSRCEALERDGYRVLGVAWKREADDCEHARSGDEAALTFAGFAAFEDPPKPGAGEALRQLSALGIRPVIVTGDNELVAVHLCKALDIEVRGVLTGSELSVLDDGALLARVERTNLFCRVNPVQKRRVIEALVKRGHVVGYLGDGINDAPSLHAAAVGISVDGAADVAKDAADLIMLQPDLSVLRDGVIEGRRTLGNILKYIMMGTSSNFGNMFSMAGAALFLPFLPMLPVQILLNNFLYDLSEVPIPSDTVDAAFTARPHRLDTGFIRRFMLIVGPISSLFDFATFYCLWHLFGANPTLFRSGWFVESLATQVLVIFVIRTRGSAWHSRPSRWLTVTSLGVVLCALLLPFAPFASRLGFAPLPRVFFGVLALLVVAYLSLVELVKRWFYRRFGDDLRR